VELEQRIKTLEYEMKILKNEIQRTLLDIQEQVLIHYYPALRTEETAPSEGTLQAFETVRTKQAEATPPPAPIARKVSLEEVRATHSEGAAVVSAVARSKTEIDQATMVKLSEWVNGTSAQLGADRIAKLIETCVNQGILAPDTKTFLIRLAALNKDAQPAKVALNDVLAALLKLDELLGRPANVEEALTLIEEAQLG